MKVRKLSFVLIAVSFFTITGCSNPGETSEITTRNDTTTDFVDGMSNKIPVGAKVFSTKKREDILIVEVDGDLSKYLAIVEG